MHGGISEGKELKKKICFVIPSLQCGGMERVMSELLNYFSANNNYELHLILYGQKREIFYKINNSIFIHKPRFDFNNAYRFYYSLKTLFYLRKVIKQINPVSILSFGELWNNFVLISTLGLKYPVYVSDRSSPAKRYKISQELLRKILYKNASAVIVQTEKAKEIYKNKFIYKNIVVIGNPIRAISSLQKAARENTVLTVGRLIKTKHHDELIKIFLKINMPGWKLIIAGDDAQKQKNRAKLEKMIKDNNAEEKVILAGTVENLDELYLKSKIFAFTSSSEGFPNVIGEAQAAGLPVIAFDCIAGPSDLIENGINGILIPLFDYKAYEEKLRILMRDENLRFQLGEKARESIKNFSIENICKKFEKILLGNANTPN